MKFLAVIFCVMVSAMWAYDDFNSTQTQHRNYGPEGAFMPLDYGSPGDFELLDGKRKKNQNAQNNANMSEEVISNLDSNANSANSDTQISDSNASSGGFSRDKNGRLVLNALAPIYFDFDRYDIRPDMREYVRANADFIKERQIASLVLQGNTDEVGSDEYNMALGHKRAIAVRDALVVYGLPQGMFSTISYGTHNPVCLEHTKACHAKNRRTEIATKN